MQPSPYQQAIYDFVRNEHGSLIVVARAGSGKTTSLMGCLENISQFASVHLFGFNADTTRDLKTAIDKLRERTGLRLNGVRASTFHALGYGAILRKLGLKPEACKADGNKVSKMLRDGLGQLEYDMYSSYVAKLVSLAKGMGIGVLSPDTDDAWYSLIGHHDLFLDDRSATEERAIELARTTLAASNALGLKGNIDFDDQLYLPLLWRVKLWQNDFVFIDEAQDTNPVRRAIAKLALKPGGRLIAVGDPRQAIYGFTGASHDALDLIKEEFNCRELPLSVCYRCGKDIIAVAQTIEPTIMPWEDSPTGKVEYIEPTEKTSWAFLETMGPGDAIICRNTAPLVKLAYKLIGRGKGCTIAGREIGKGLIELIKKLKAHTIEALEKGLDFYQSREVAKFTAKGEEAKAEAVNDRVDCIRTVIDFLGENERTIEMLKYKIEALFSDQGETTLLLSTIHKSKGREWRTVCIYGPELMPSKWARQAWQANQEDNLRYVAVTRARERLVFLTQLDVEKK